MSHVLRTLVAVFVCATVFLPAAPAIAAEHLSRTERVPSEVLGETREVRVFLPASYGEFEDGRYPVLFMVDGDYNYLFVTGLLEQMSSISEQIPEMIFVAIDDRGKDEYRRNMAPTLGEDGGDSAGNASTFLRFLADELVPHIESRFRVGGYRALAGHSMGGLFTVSAMLERPDFFDAFIAISPSLWWQEQALVKEAERILDALAAEPSEPADSGVPELATRLYLTVADEAGMGVLGFADLLDRKAPASLDWRFERDITENHGSIGLPSLRSALRSEFEGFTLSADEFYALDGSHQVVEHYRHLAQTRGDFLLPRQMLSNVLNFYLREELPAEIERLEATVAEHFPASLPLFRLALASHYEARERWQDALDLYREVVETHPHSYSAMSGAALVQSRLARSEPATSDSQAEAEQLINRAIELAQTRGARRWQLNQLQADRRQIEATKTAVP